MNKQFTKSVITVALRLLISAGLGLVLSSYLARMLGPRDNGIYALAILLPTIAVMFGNLGLNSAAVYLMGKEITQARAVVTNLFFCSALLGLLSLMLTIGSLQLAADKWAVNIPRQVLIISLLVIPILVLYTNMVAVFQGLQEFRTLGFLTLAPIATTLLITACWLPTSGDRLVSAVFFWACGYSIALVLTLYQLFIAIKPTIEDLKVRKKIIIDSLSYGFVAYLGNLVTFANYRINYYLIASFIGLKELGIYSTTIPLTEGIWLFSNSVSSVIFPIIAKAGNASQEQSYTPAISSFVFTITVAASIGLAVFSEPLIAVLFGTEYNPAALILRILLPGVAIFSISKVLSNDIAGRGRPDINLWITTASLAVNLGLNAVLIPIFKLEGAALATSLTLIFYTLVTMKMYSKIAGAPFLSPVVLRREDVFSILKALAAIARKNK